MFRIKWKTIGVSLPGFSHQANGTPCQDSLHISSFGDGWLVAAVSDGAGSASRCVEGAEAVCKGVVSQIGHKIRQANSVSDFRFDEVTIRSWVSESIERVRTDLAQIDESISVFHATLVGVIANLAGGMFFHIGDGAGLATNVDDFASVLSLPENGEVRQ
jgi:hypothetical protein